MKMKTVKKNSLVKRFLISMSALCLSIVFLWVAFYYLSVKVSTANLIQQAEIESESMITTVENELLSIEDTAYALVHYDRIIEMVKAPDVLSFYDLGEVARERGDSIIGNYNSADNVVVFNRDGMFYRLRGNISNTALKRIFFLVNSNSSSVFTISVGGNSYICVSDNIWENDENLGYCVLLLEENRLEQLMASIQDIDYIGAVLIAQNRIISQTDSDFSSIDNIMDNSIFVKEKEIGLSGLKLIVYCTEKISETISTFFKIVLPITIVLLLSVLGAFIYYFKRHMMTPINTVIANTNQLDTKPLPYTGEEYFDGMVDHVNDMLKRVAESESELYETKLQINNMELETEKNLISLLKKQISAHFTVNTLNAVRALINKGDREQAVTLCDELSALFRYANAGEEYISLMEEFYILEQYAGIMKTRYPGKFEFYAEENDDLSTIFIPRMLLQPLVENAIVHGFIEKGGTIRVHAERNHENNNIEILVEDNGVGIDEAALIELRKSIHNFKPEYSDRLGHIALANISRRIQLVCGEEFGLFIDSKKNAGTTVKLILPCWL